METNKLLTEEQLRARLQISHQTVWRYCREGLLPKPVRLGKRSNRWRLSDIEEFERSREIAPAYTGKDAA
jgi:prophage regulatory protein